jgi:hypothetical protein
VLLVEPFAIDRPRRQHCREPDGRAPLHGFVGDCTPNSLSQEVGLGLGSQGGGVRMRDVFMEAGYTKFRRAAETPLKLILEARQ